MTLLLAVLAVLGLGLVGALLASGASSDGGEP